MGVKSINPGITTYPQPGSRIRYAQSSNNLSSNDSHCSPSKALSLRTIKLPTSSIHRGKELSQQLLSLICKFEALDAVSLPAKYPSLRAPPLQPSLEASRNGENVTSQKRRLSVIFSPRIGSKDTHAEICHESDFTSKRDVVGSTNSAGFPASRTENESRKCPELQFCYKTSNSILHSSSGSHGQAPQSYNIVPYVKKDSSSKRKSIRDIIRLYDGCADKSVSPAVSIGGNNARLSAIDLPIALFQTPKKRLSHPRNRLIGSTGNSNERYGSTRPNELIIPAAFCKHPAVKQWNETVGRPILENIPTLDKRRASWGRSKNQYERSVSQGVTNHDSLSLIHPRQNSGNTEETRIQKGDRGHTRARRPWEEQPTNLGKGEISDNLEVLYCAKSLERKLDILRETSQQNETTSLTLQSGQLDSEMANKGVESRKFLRGRFTVADIRKRFEGSTTFIPVPASLSVDMAATIPVVPLTLPPTLPHLPSFNSKRTSGVSPKTVLEIIPAIEKRLPAMLEGERKHLRLQGKNKSIVEKMKIFESIRESQVTNESQNPRGSHARKTRISLTRLFKQSSPDSEEEDEKNKQSRLSSEPTRDIVDELQDTVKNAKLRKRDAWVRRQSTMPNIPHSLETDGARSEKGVGSPCQESAKEMIVKEAECGLEQPRPLRVMEMKRMVLLCRERVGIIRDNKERAAYKRRVLL